MIHDSYSEYCIDFRSFFADFAYFGNFSLNKKFLYLVLRGLTLESFPTQFQPLYCVATIAAEKRSKTPQQNPENCSSRQVPFDQNRS